MKKGKGVLIIELKGFSEIANSLVYRMEKIALKNTHIRLKYRNIISDIVNKSNELYNWIDVKEIGGDTWVVEYESIDKAINGGCFILHLTYQEVIKTGLFYLKPVISVGEANPTYEGDRFLDNDSINIYRIADHGDPFSLYVYNYNKLKETEIIEEETNHKLLKLKETIEFKELDWREKIFSQDQLGISPSFYLSSLLHENDIAYFQSYQESYQKFIELQGESKIMYIYGGCIRYNNKMDDIYVKSIFELFQKKDCISHVICYVDLQKNIINNYYWLRISQTLMSLFPNKYIFSFYEVDLEKNKPLSYHVYNEEYILINLRDFDPASCQTKINSSILIRNKKLAIRFTTEFLENFRNIKKISDETLDKIIKSIEIPKKDKENIERYISEQIKDYA